MKTDITIKVENLSKVYHLRHSRVEEDGKSTQQHWALKDISFEIKKGESVGIIGPNGSGKSTLLQILAGVTKPTSGIVSIKGKVASVLEIGAGFHPELSGRENIYLNGQIHGFTNKEIESEFEEIIIFSGIGKFIDEPVKNYSQGMYLRLAFSIMAHLDFDVYLLDEVLSVGDAEFQNKCIEKILSISKSQKTILIVYHNMYFADKIVSREIDLRLINKNLRFALDDKKKEKDYYFDEVITLENGILNCIRISTKVLKENPAIKKGTLLLKSSMDLSLAASPIIIFDQSKIKSLDYLEYQFDINLATGNYTLNLYDITTDNSLFLIHSILLQVLKNKNYLGNFSDRSNSVLLLNPKQIN